MIPPKHNKGEREKVYTDALFGLHCNCCEVKRANQTVIILVQRRRPEDEVHLPISPCSEQKGGKVELEIRIHLFVVILERVNDVRSKCLQQILWLTRSNWILRVPVLTICLFVAEQILLKLRGSETQ